MEDLCAGYHYWQGSFSSLHSPQIARLYGHWGNPRLALHHFPTTARFGAVYRLDYYDQAAMQSIVPPGYYSLDVETDKKGLLKLPAGPGHVCCVCSAVCVTNPRCAAVVPSIALAPARH